MSGVLLTPVLKNLATGEGACGRAGPPFMVAISLSQTKPRVPRFFEHFAKGGNGNVSTTERARNRSRVSLPALEKARGTRDSGCGMEIKSTKGSSTRQLRIRRYRYELRRYRFGLAKN